VDTLSAGLTKTPVRGWTVLLFFRFQESSAAMTSLAFGFFLPFIREDLGLTYGQSGMLQLANGIPGLVLIVPFTAIFSRFRPVGLIFICSLIAIPFLMLQGLAGKFLVSGFVALFILRMLFATFRVAEAPARTLLLQQWAARKDFVLFNSVALSTHSLLMASSFALLPIIITAVGGWRTALPGLGAILLLEIIIWRFMALEKKAPLKTFDRALKGKAPNPFLVLKRYPQIVILGIVMFALGVMWSGMVTFVPTLLKENRNIALSWGGPLSSLLYFGLAFTAPFGDWIGKRIPNTRVLLVGTALANTVVGVAIALTPNPWALMALFFALGAVWAPTPPIMIMPFSFKGITSREVAVASSLQGVLGGAGFTFGPVITGFAADATGSLVTGLVAMSIFTGIGVLAGFFYPSPPKTPAPVVAQAAGA
jgi:MFS family permease